MDGRVFAKVADGYERRGGHPVGASGVRMLVDAAKRVSGAAGDYQVEGAKTFGTLNFGGSTATTVSFVVSAAEGS
jgi:acetyl-CoA C-acetyltransferase